MAPKKFTVYGIHVSTVEERHREPFPSESLSTKEFCDLKMGFYERWRNQCVCQRIVLKKKVKIKSLCLTNQALCHEGVWGSGCIDPHFLGLGINWR
jgi:hypothetical protein